MPVSGGGSLPSGETCAAASILLSAYGERPAVSRKSNPIKGLTDEFDEKERSDLRQPAGCRGRHQTPSGKYGGPPLRRLRSFPGSHLRSAAIGGARRASGIGGVGSLGSRNGPR